MVFKAHESFKLMGSHIDIPDEVVLQGRQIMRSLFLMFQPDFTHTHTCHQGPISSPGSTGKFIQQMYAHIMSLPKIQMPSQRCGLKNKCCRQSLAVSKQHICLSFCSRKLTNSDFKSFLTGFNRQEREEEAANCRKMIQVFLSIASTCPK